MKYDLLTKNDFYYLVFAVSTAIALTFLIMTAGDSVQFYADILAVALMSIIVGLPVLLVCVVVYGVIIFRCKGKDINELFSGHF